MSKTRFADWAVVTHGCSDTRVVVSPDGSTYAKTALSDDTGREVRDERDRLLWLAETDVPCPRVLDFVEESQPTLVTSAVPGIAACDVSAAHVAEATRGCLELLARLHALPVADCPFDRRLAVTVPDVRRRVAAGLVDEDDFDPDRHDKTALDLMADLEAGVSQAAELESGDLAVVHGDACLPNLMLDPETWRPTGVIDVGRLGVADRHWDLALLSRSVACQHQNTQYGDAEGALVLAGADWQRVLFYRLMDEFF